ncbi:predicted protein [Uncinocarpus reesii 1704]|uniref:Nuclear fusion protein KAR5 n=1 Tax=Uncinocarpus reesii (strain UAMH 1704) TaxID=336963 RepID=C4JGZ6_UNCRE|nr:uncharacterized protein UREG_01247 [Uncinocarpus reesii 1704]EEP76398.1 predicted protein [Uncinocarpus reesii 1704]
MDRTKMFRPFLYLFLLSCFPSLAQALKFPHFQRGSNVVPVAPKAAAELTSLLHLDNVKRNEIFSEAIRLLDSMQSSSSCNQRAVTDLLMSCQALEGNQREHDQDFSLQLDQFKSLYAARLAVCELRGAGATVPDKCLPILNSSKENTEPQFHETFHRGSKEHRGVPAQLESCLHSLESRPQWWTSYSNNRQNAAVMCQAARFDIERDELLKHHRKLAKITFGLTESLNQSLTDAANEAVKQHVFLNLINDLRSRIIADLQDVDVTARTRFASFVSELEVQIRQTSSETKEFMADILSDTGLLSKDIRSSIQSIQDLKERVNEAYIELMKRNSESAAAAQENQQANIEVVSAVRQSLDQVKDQIQVLNNQEFSLLHSSLRSLNGLIFSMHQKQTSLDQVSLP